MAEQNGVVMYKGRRGGFGSMLVEPYVQIRLGLMMVLLNLIGMTFFVIVKYTHKIYGPLISIYRFLDDLIDDKQPAPLKLRESDELGDLVVRLNKIVEKFQNQNRHSS